MKKTLTIIFVICSVFMCASCQSDADRAYEIARMNQETERMRMRRLQEEQALEQARRQREAEQQEREAARLQAEQDAALTQAAFGIGWMIGELLSGD